MVDSSLWNDDELAGGGAGLDPRPRRRGGVERHPFDVQVQHASLGVCSELFEGGDALRAGKGPVGVGQDADELVAKDGRCERRRRACGVADLDDSGSQMSASIA